MDVSTQDVVLRMTMVKVQRGYTVWYRNDDYEKHVTSSCDFVLHRQHYQIRIQISEFHGSVGVLEVPQLVQGKDVEGHMPRLEMSLLMGLLSERGSEGGSVCVERERWSK